MLLLWIPMFFVTVPAGIIWLLTGWRGHFSHHYHRTRIPCTAHHYQSDNIKLSPVLQTSWQPDPRQHIILRQLPLITLWQPRRPSAQSQSVYFLKRCLMNSIWWLKKYQESFRVRFTGGFCSMNGKGKLAALEQTKTSWGLKQCRVQPGSCDTSKIYSFVPTHPSTDNTRECSTAGKL